MDGSLESSFFFERKGEIVHMSKELKGKDIIDLHTELRHPSEEST